MHGDAGCNLLRSFGMHSFLSPRSGRKNARHNTDSPGIKKPGITRPGTKIPGLLSSGHKNTREKSLPGPIQFNKESSQKLSFAPGR
jgi:hypothetical protein